ncbi:Hypothetical protein SRAE_X000225100 [Strongyloides ratti]|uniref:Uncharacterized protein n=1 Tax=Strongyloides ratti TaxID=34506 RepID=A0A090MQR2_STRRB|nr:Hypothetical protein SRAE_X000225100 [Strongyloides ratti]CEF60513.1 Hypothetical protein SRAE_X000225100 [Strongyloides ratti]
MIDTMSTIYSPVSSYNLSIRNSNSPESINQLPTEIDSPNNSSYSSTFNNFVSNTNDQNNLSTYKNEKKSKLARNVDRWKGRNEANKQKYKNSLFFNVSESRKNVENVTKSIIEEIRKKEEEENVSNTIQEKNNSFVNENVNFNGKHYVQNHYNRQMPYKNNDITINMNNLANDQQNYQNSNAYIEFEKYAEQNYKSMLNFNQHVYQNHINNIPMLNLPPISINNNPNQTPNFSKNQSFDNNQQNYNSSSNIYRKTETKISNKNMIHGQFETNRHNNYNNINNTHQMENYDNPFITFQANQNMFHSQNFTGSNSLQSRFQAYVNNQQIGTSINFLNNQNNYCG